MNKNCFPIGLNMKYVKPEKVLCIKKKFDFSLEKRILDKIYGNERTKAKSTKTHHKKQNIKLQEKDSQNSPFFFIKRRYKQRFFSEDNLSNSSWSMAGE